MLANSRLSNEEAHRVDMLMYAHSICSEAMKSLRRNLIRTVLTVLGLVVGIAAFICVVGVGKAGSAKGRRTAAEAGQQHDLDRGG